MTDAPPRTSSAPQGITIIRVQRPFVHRTVPVLPRDEVDIGDADFRAEDHAGDESRYRPLPQEPTALTRKD